MSLSRDLIEQARHLARRETRRPRQASLRRAVSAAYYAAFHLLVHDGARMLASGTQMPGLRRMYSRAFTHDEMKSVCQHVSQADWPPKVRANIGAILIPPELQDVAETFVDLQQDRHQADYDTQATYHRSQVEGYIDATQKLFDDWQLVRRQPAGRVFLAALFTMRKIKS